MLIGTPRVHAGVCDASAAVFVHRGSTHFLVADDEDQSHTLLRLYDAGANGPPLREHCLSNDALQPDPDEPEIDLEGSSWLGERIFWIGSHSRSKKGKPRPSRHRLFATAFKDGAPVVDGSPYTTLLRDIEQQLSLKLDKRLAPKEGGVSIEGLSRSDQAGELLVAFRSPLVEGKAAVIPINNADAVVDSGAPAELGRPVLLHLGGLGIRSLEYWPERSSYLIVAGPTGDEEASCRLLRWSGPPSDKLELLDNVDFDRMGIDGGTPEGLLIEPNSGTVYFLFDEGRRIVDGVQCKDAPKRSFRSVSIRGLLP